MPPPPFTQADVLALLGTRVDRAAATRALSMAAARLRIGEPFSRDQVAELLEALASEPGTLGIVARFAKARVILM